MARPVNSQTRRAPLAQLRARIRGVIDWICPFCASLNRTRVSGMTYAIRCQESKCRRLLQYGLRFMTISTSMGNIGAQGERAHIPIDRIVPDYARKGLHGDELAPDDSEIADLAEYQPPHESLKPYTLLAPWTGKEPLNELILQTDEQYDDD